MSSFLILVVRTAAVLMCVVAAAATTTAGEIIEPEIVCPSDYFINTVVGGSGVVGRRLLQQRNLAAAAAAAAAEGTDGEDEEDDPRITIVRQGGSYVEFTVQNTTAWDVDTFSKKPEYIYTSMQTDVYGSLHCSMTSSESLSSSSETMKAICEDRPNSAGPVAVVKVFLRYRKDGENAGGDIDIPKCCSDPYVETTTTTTTTTTTPSRHYKTVAYVLLLNCTVACDDPNAYISRLPSSVISASPSSSPRAQPSAAPSSSVRVPRRSLQKEIIKDMMPESSSQCTSQSSSSSTRTNTAAVVVTNTTYTFESSQADSEWNPAFAEYEQDVFLAKMQNIDAVNSNRSWTIRLGRAGNIYSLVGPMGETVPPQNHDKAPWVDEVWQAVQPLGSNGDNDGNADTGPYFIHEAGTYQKDGDYTATKPFYSPTTGSYCNSDEHECGFSSWGQQAHLPTPWKSPMLYFNRYRNCGDGVFEYTTLRHNSVGSSDTFGYLNVPWGGTRTSVLGDIVLTNKDTQEQNVVYPLRGWSDGESISLKNTMGYTIFTEDLPKGADPLHDTLYPLPDGLDLTIGGGCYCEGNCRQSTHRYVCPLVAQPTNIGWAPNRGSPGVIVRLEGRDTGRSVVAGIRHWAGNSRLYFYQSDVLTLAQVQEALTVGTKVDAFYYLPPESGKPEEDNLALAHVHGNSWNGNYPRIRYGAAGRDYNVYTVNDNPRIDAGSTYYYRQYFMMDAYTEMKTKGAQWGPEALKATKTVGTIKGRAIQLYKSASAATSTFGHIIEGDTCRSEGVSATPICEGMTTPQENSKALFEIRCGESFAVTEDMYYFSPDGPPYRSYVCDGMVNQRPQWTLLGYFPEGSCSAIGSGYQYDDQYC